MFDRFMSELTYVFDMRIPGRQDALLRAWSVGILFSTLVAFGIAKILLDVNFVDAGQFVRTLWVSIILVAIVFTVATYFRRHQILSMVDRFRKDQKSKISLLAILGLLWALLAVVIASIIIVPKIVG